MNDSWSLVYEGFDPKQEPLREALCTLGNGVFATRGAAPESTADDVHYPGTYRAGVYDRLETEIAGRVVENEDLVNLPNWLPLSFRIEDGPWFDLREVEILEHRQKLDLRTGVLTRVVRFRDRRDRVTRLTQRRLVHMGDAHLAALESAFLAENWSGPMEVRSALDGRLENRGVARYRQLRGDHLVPVETGEVDEETVFLVTRTRTSHLRVAEAARTLVLRGGVPMAVERRTAEEPGYVAHHLVLPMEQGTTLVVDKVVTLFTSQDRAIYEPGVAARTRIGQVGGFEDLLAAHTVAWEHLWRRFDIRLDGSERAQAILRVHIFHVLQTVSERTVDLDVGVPARGLHGEAYRGHVFWDELFVFPLINYRLSVLTRSLLAYRRRRLPEARRAAREAGYEGAMYPWQSGSDGREETQRLHLNPRSGRWLPDNSHLQRHINIAVAYNVWQHYQVTGNLEFLRYLGAPILVEIARFLVSLTSLDEDRGRYEICGVMGPDEYHDAYPDAEEPGLHNNAYTNLMTVGVLVRALRLFEILPAYQVREMRAELRLGEEELSRWEDISRRMFIPFHGDRIISQFEGYEDLEEFDFVEYRERYGDIHRLDRILEAEGDTTNRYKVSKQADVLMLFYLLSAQQLRDLFGRLGYRFDPETDMARNAEYYLDRTVHGSTLSRLVHSWVLARLDRPKSWQFLLEALESDVADTQGGTTPEGIHLGAMAGTVDLVQRGYGGLEARDDVLWMDPALPEEVTEVRFGLRYRGHRILVSIRKDRLRVSSRPGTASPVRVGLGGEVVVLEQGQTREHPLS